MGKIYEALERAEEMGSKDGQGTGLPLELVPLFENRELVVLSRPGSPLAEQFRFLRTRITRPAKGRPKRTILITSALQGEGKSFVACNLAATLAQGLDEYVLLVDADLRRPRVSKLLGLESTSEGLSTYLSRGTPLEELMKKTDVEKLTVLPAGTDTINPVELLSSKRMQELIREVRDRYPDRFVIFDSPPMELAPESFVIANEVESVFFVVRRSRTPRDAVRAALERIDQEKFSGIILNGYERPAKQYKGYKGNAYKYGYGYGYGQSYSKPKD